jgi:hypothetical protein
MPHTLQKRIHTLVRQVLDSYPGAWLVWCDPRGDWQPLLQRVATDNRMGGFPLVAVTEQTAGAVGSLTARQTVQAHIDAEESFVLLINAAPDALGWLWAQALLAEQLYTRSLREQLLTWGWQSQSLTITDAEVALLAQQGIQQDPAEWGGGGLQPDLRLLLDVLAGGDTPEPHQQLLLDMTISYVGLPPLAGHDIAVWRSRSLARLLVTQAHAVAPSLIPTTHDLLIAEGQRPQALHLLERWRDSLRLSRGLPDAILEADRIAAPGPLLEQASSTHGPFLSHAAEMTVFTTTCHRLAQKQGKTLLHALASLQDDVQRHIQGLWGTITSHPQAKTIAWSELLRLSQAAQTLLTVTPDEWPDLDAAIAWYTEGGWQLDQAGDAMLRTLPQAAAALLSLVTALRAAFRARWERTLIQWSDLWIQAGCPIPNLPTAGEWLKAQLDSAQPTALLVIDALRYDLGAGLVAAVNQREGAERALLTPARAPLPSITALGMGYAMPIHETDLRAELVGSTWHLWHEPSQTDLSSAANRRAWWQAQQHLAAENLLTLPDALSGPLPEPTRQRARLVITDALIDKLGHDDELDVLGTQVAQNRYVDAIMRLRDSGWRRILVVTDHGFIHWSGSSEKSMPPPQPDPAYKSRRALAYPATTPVTAPHVHAPGGGWRVVPAQGAATWSSYGGLGYFHGGASLQEWIIPCIAMTWPGKAAALEVTLQPLTQILTQRPRVTLLIQRASLFPEDAVARPVEVVIRETAHQTVLFRSARVDLRPDHEQQTVPLQPVSGAAAQRGTALRIEVRDAQTEAVLADSTSTLLIALDEW